MRPQHRGNQPHSFACDENPHRPPSAQRPRRIRWPCCDDRTITRPEDPSRSLEQLFEIEAETVFGFLLLRTGSRPIAEDLTAETFAEASRRHAEGRGHEVTGAWLMTVARRRLVDHWRRAASQRSRLERLAREPRGESPPTDDPDTCVELALSALPSRQRAALVLRYVDELSVPEIADALETSYRGAESLLSRARAAFIRSYEAEAEVTP